MNCASVSTSTAPAGSLLISADTPSADGTRIFAFGSPFQLSFVTNAPSADKLTWSISNDAGKVVNTGSFPVSPGPTTTTLKCTSTLAGYFAASATLAKKGGQLQSAGTRPTGTLAPRMARTTPLATCFSRKAPSSHAPTSSCWAKASIRATFSTARTIQAKSAMGRSLIWTNATESPVYVVSHNASVAKANATTPAGYTPG
jgi:hypothetical protein